MCVCVCMRACDCVYVRTYVCTYVSFIVGMGLYIHIPPCVSENEEGGLTVLGTYP